MLETLVSLNLDDPANAPADVEVELRTNALQMQPRFRLWNQLGRDPRAPQPVAGKQNTWTLGSAEGLRGWTLTWSVRLAATGARGPAYFELRIRVLKKDALLPGGDVYYTGPLEGVEERHGRLHFSDSTSG